MPGPPLPRLDRLQAILFDVGGTLVELDYAFIAECARDRGLAIEPEALRRGEAVSRRQVDAAARRRGGALASDAQRRAGYLGGLLAEAGVPRQECPALVAQMEVAHARRNLWRVEVRGAARTLAGLRQRGLRTAVVSNADGRVQAILATLGLAAHLSLVLDSHLEGVEKPDPEIFRRALSRLGVAPARAAYVGDIYSIDVVGARAAGLTPILLDPTDGYADADCPRLRSLEELLG
jgi:putative hydrolase of the HAD superfamily